MESYSRVIVTIIISVVATSGFWTFLTVYLQRRLDKKDCTKAMLIGLGHDRIVYLGLQYIERGWVSQTEYENLKDYLCNPYCKLGGNGVAHKIMIEVDKLPIRQISIEQIRNGERKGDTSLC